MHMNESRLETHRQVVRCWPQPWAYLGNTNRYNMVS
jgi:hypothetical protein